MPPKKDAAPENPEGGTQSVEGAGYDPLNIPRPTAGRIVIFYENAASHPWPAIVTFSGHTGIMVTVFATGRVPYPFMQVVPHVNERMTDGPAWKWPDGTREHYMCPPCLRGQFPGAPTPYGPGDH